MKRIFGTKKDKTPPKTLEEVSGGLDKRVDQYVACLHYAWASRLEMDETIYILFYMKVGPKNFKA